MLFKKTLITSMSVLLLSSNILPSTAYVVNADTIQEDSIVLDSELLTSFSSGYITGYLDENGEIQFYEHVGQERGLFTTIAVFVGGALVGYISASVIDGIVIAATGQSGAEWVATAIRSVVGKRYTRSIYLPPSGPYTCPGVVIDHSGRCP